MSKIDFPELEGATALTAEDKLALIPDYLSTRDDLNAVEQANIAKAALWVRGIKLDDMLNASFIFDLHKRMFGDVWKWAGKQRRSNTNIGVTKEHILQELGQLLKQTHDWYGSFTFSNEEIAVRFHHRLVQIHVFSDGNGRHARLMTDQLLRTFSLPEFSWGAKDCPSHERVRGEIRSKYREALRAADKGDYSLLLAFVRS